MNTSGCCFGSQASGPLESSFASRRTPSLVAKGVVQLSPWASAAEPASPSNRSAAQKALEASGCGVKRRNGMLMAYLLRVYWNRLRHGPRSRLHWISLAKTGNRIVPPNRGRKPHARSLADSGNNWIPLFDFVKYPGFRSPAHETSILEAGFTAGHRIFVVGLSRSSGNSIEDDERLQTAFVRHLETDPGVSLFRHKFRACPRAPTIVVPT